MVGPLRCEAGLRRGRRPAREPSARCVVSMPGQATPPPTSAAAGPHHCPRAPRPGPVALFVLGAAVLRWWASVYTREKVRPAWSDGGCEREKVRPARSQHPKFGVFALARRSFSRKCHCRGGVGRTLSRQPVLCPGLVAMRRTSGWLRWGFCAMRSPLAACRRRVGALHGVIPPDWWRKPAT